MDMRRRVGRSSETADGLEIAEPTRRDGTAARWARDPPVAESTLRRADGGTQASVLGAMQASSGNTSVQRLFGFGEDEDQVEETGDTGGQPIEEAPTETFAREQQPIEGGQGGGTSPGRERVAGEGLTQEEPIGQQAGEQTEGGGSSTGEAIVGGEGLAEEEPIEGVSEEETTPAGTGTDQQDVADRVHAAGEGFGTDEAALFSALRSLGRSAAGIAAMKATFVSRFGQSVEDFLQDELSGPELEEGLLLISPQAA